MVTMRRDVAAAKNLSGTYDGLSAYDRFIMKKNARRNEEIAEESATKVSESFSERLNFAPKKRSENQMTAATVRKTTVADDTVSAYDQYLIGCLSNKKANERVLSSEEFYASMLASPKKTRAVGAYKANKKAVREKADKQPGKFSKIGKIILSVYVLVVLATAFTLIAVNVFNTEPVLADAETNIVDGAKSIRPMTTETLEKEEESWFDSLCDAVKK